MKWLCGRVLEKGKRMVSKSLSACLMGVGRYFISGL